MVIRRIREHVATHNWFAVAVDLAIVVVGVFIGIQASNWNAARTERGESREYRAQIVENLNANEREIMGGEQYYRQVRAHGLAALRAFEGDAPQNQAFLVHAYQASQYWPVRMEQAAYDEMLAGGMIKNFGDAALRRQLTSYYSSIRQFELTANRESAYRDRIRRALTYSVQQRVRDRCGDVIGKTPAGSQLATLPDACAPGLTTAQVEHAVARLRDTEDLDRDLTRQLAELDQKIALFGRILRRIRQMRRDLQRLKL